MNYKNKSRFDNPYGRLYACTPQTTRSANGVIYPQYGQTDAYMARYNQLAIYNQNMNVEAKVYEDLLAAGMGPY